MRLSVFDRPPADLERLAAHQLSAALDGPTLVSLPGRRGQPLFLSTLLHGNEVTSWEVARGILAAARKGNLERSVLLFIGNIPAAAKRLRYLAGQPDYNRIWSGGERPEHRLATEVLEIVRAARPFAVIDIHNNTGRNPFYSCVSRIEPAHLHLASMFSPTAVYYTNPNSALSIACSEFAPAIAIECGKSGDASGVEKARKLVFDAMAEESWRSDFHFVHGLRLYHTLGRLFLQEGPSYSFDGSPADVMLTASIEDWNFRTAEAGSVWAHTTLTESPLRVVDQTGADITGDFFVQKNGETRLIVPATPSMLTTDIDNIRLDCFGYLMEPISFGSAA